METLNKKEKDNFIKKDNCSNGGITNKNDECNINRTNHKKTKNIYLLNNIPKNNRKANKKIFDKKLTQNSSFLAFRKNSNRNMNKDAKNPENSNALDENNINMASISNISSSYFLEKNDNIFRNYIRTNKIKGNNNTAINTINTINKINSIYGNQFDLKFKMKKEKSNAQNINNNILNNNKILVNNFINKSRTFNYLADSQMFRKNTSKIFKRFCFICESFEEKLYHTKNCKHLFCKDCGQSYYEQQIDNYIYNI